MKYLPTIVAPPQLEAMQRLAMQAPQGDFAEVGVLQGGSASYLYEVAVAQNRTLHLFDTFKGTPVHKTGLDKHLIDDEFKPPPGTVETIQAALPKAKLYVGTYPETHPKDLESLAFIHCDCDQYASYWAVIHYMWPLVVVGGMLLFDDYPYLLGAKVAVEETFRSIDLHLCGTRYYAIKKARSSGD